MQDTQKYVDNEQDRRTGRSTARMLLALGYACLNQGVPVPFVDHMPNTGKQLIRHRDILRSYVNALKLKADVKIVGKQVYVTAKQLGNNK